MNAPDATAPAPVTAELVKVELGARQYDILVGDRLLDGAGRLIRPVLPAPRVVTITDANVAPLYLERLQASLAAAGIEAGEIVLPAGEQTKDFAHLEKLIDDLLDLRIERSTTLIALGGGVVGDIVGFAASIVLRGVDFVQIPTTLLAQVDSSVGGKTGINTRHGKNLVGAFYQPRLVLADLDTLDTLPARHVGAGYAEVAKYGLLGDAEFFAWLEAHGAAMCTGDKAAQRHAIAVCCRAKADVVAEDERETGRRALLNLGHTFGHAFEAETGFGERLLHGEAIALGILRAFELSAEIGLTGEAETERVRAHFAAVGLPVALGDVAGVDWQTDKLLAHMATDKKVRDGRLSFILVRAIGDAFQTRDVDVQAVRRVLDRAVA